MRAKLDALASRYDRAYLDSDPIGVVRRYETAGDREIAGILAAGLSYGRVASIRASLDRLFRAIGPSPSRFVDAFDERRDARRLRGFTHRFTGGDDVAVLCALLRRARASSGSLEAFFVEGDPDPNGPTLGPAMDAFVARLFALDAGRLVPGGRVPATHGARRLLSAPSGGSACKRHCLFLRWMVRPDDGVDCGLWPRVRRARLVVPLDTHVERVARALGWTRRRSAGWPMALEVTGTLRRLDPDDPLRYDFALCRLGILGKLEAPGGKLPLSLVAAALP